MMKNNAPRRRAGRRAGPRTAAPATVISDDARVLSADERRQLRAALKERRGADRIGLMIDIALVTGLRIREILSLRILDVYDPEIAQPRRTLAIDRRRTKGQRRGRTVSLICRDDKLREAIAAYARKLIKAGAAADWPLFCVFDLATARPKKRAVDPRNADSELRRIATAAAVKPFGWHVLRKTCASIVYAETRDLSLVSQLLGHKNTNVTAVYLGINIEYLIEATAAINTLAA